MPSPVTPPATVAVVGLGYVGLPLALLAARKGYRVVGIDIDAEKIERLQERRPPFSDVRIVAQLATTTLEATTDFARIQAADVVVVCVPTPVFENHLPNLGPLESACTLLAPHLHRGQLFVLESTVNPGVCEGVVLPLLEGGSGLVGGRDFVLSHCPERINPGDPKWTVEVIPRVVGSLEPAGLSRTVDFYRSLVSAPITPMGSLREAEAVKIVENSYRDINIAFVNELARSFTRLGIDVVRVINGAATKPFGYQPFYPGVGVGGHCIPVDPYYLIEYAEENGFHHDFLSLARRINDAMPEFTAQQVFSALNEVRVAIKGARVAVLGLAYKPDVDDCRESPAFPLIRTLRTYGAEVVAYDPHVGEHSTAKSLPAALHGSQAAVIATDHRRFRSLRPDDFLEHGVRVVVDGRNCLPKDQFVSAGLVYRGIGR